MVPAAVLAAGLSAATAHRSGGSPSAALGYAVGTGLTMGLAFALFVVVAFAVDCGGGRTERGLLTRRAAPGGRRVRPRLVRCRRVRAAARRTRPGSASAATAARRSLRPRRRGRCGRSSRSSSATCKGRRPRRAARPGVAPGGDRRATSTPSARSIARHGGTIEKFIGDAVMAVFGIPRVHEDDALRAVRAALAMRAAVTGLNDELRRLYGVELANRTGVTTGEVVAGDPAAGQRLVTGDAVNVAARLEQAAGEREVLIGEPTYRLVRGARRGRAGRAARAEGEGRACAGVPAARPARAPRGRRRRPPRRAHGRVAALERALAAAERGRRCELAVVTGDAGLGKSRLLDEFARRVSGRARVVRGALPLLRRRDHVLAAARGRPGVGRDRRRRRPRGRRNRSSSAGRRPGRRRADRGGGRALAAPVPALRDLLGGAQAVRVARARPAAPLPARRRALGGADAARPRRLARGLGRGARPDRRSGTAPAARRAARVEGRAARGDWARSAPRRAAGSSTRRCPALRSRPGPAAASWRPAAGTRSSSSSSSR